MVSVARERMESLMRMAGDRTSSGEIALAKRYVQLARRIGMRYNVRMPPQRKRSFCPSCLSIYLEGINSRVRLKKGRLRHTCLACGSTSRFRYGRRSGEGLSATAKVAGVKEPALAMEESEDATGEAE